MKLGMSSWATNTGCALASQLKVSCESIILAYARLIMEQNNYIASQKRAFKTVRALLIYRNKAVFDEYRERNELVIDYDRVVKVSHEIA